MKSAENLHANHKVLLNNSYEPGSSQKNVNHCYWGLNSDAHELSERI